MEGGVVGHEVVEQELAGRGHAVPAVLRHREQGDGGHDGGDGAAKRGPLGQGRGRRTARRRHEEAAHDHRVQPGHADDQAQPVRARGGRDPQGQDERRVDGDPGQALEGDARTGDGDEGKDGVAKGDGQHPEVSIADP